MPRIVVHVGQPKAMSTSLQQALAHASDRLGEAGITYPIIRGRPDHNAAVADFIVESGATPTPTRTSAADPTRERRGEPGAWRELLAAVTSADRVIVSSELLSGLGPGLAASAIDSLTDGRPDEAAVVMVLRRVSEHLPSDYSQAALADPLPAFETWVRLRLWVLLHPDATRGDSLWLDAAWLRSSWSSVRDRREVRMSDVEAGSRDERILRALDLDGVLAPPFLPRANQRVPAAWVLAWQQRRRDRGWGPKRSRHIREISEIALSAPDDEWSRAAFALRPDVAAAVDEAFPVDHVQGAAVAVARERLAVMVGGSSPLTHVTGLDAAGLQDAVRACGDVLDEVAT